MPKSLFYQRYLESVAKFDVEAAGPLQEQAKKFDVTSGTKQAKGQKRMQIFTKSEFIDPGALDDLEIHSKTPAQRAFIQAAVSEHYLFEQCAPKEMEKIIDCMQPGAIMQQEFIIRQGDLGDLFYCLESGTADALVDGVGTVASYERRGCFGELALIYNCPRAASVVATSPCTYWTLTLKTFRTILASQSNEANGKRVEFLKKCLFLDPLTSEQISKVAVALEEVTKQDGETIVKQDDVGDTFYIIEGGAVKCTQRKADGREVELVTLRTGDYFGEMALMLNETRLASCTAIGECKLLSLTRDHFNLLLGSVQDVLASRMRIRILQSVPLLAKMPEAKLVRLAGAMRVQSFPAESYIIKQGEEGSRFFIISEGEVRCTRTVSTSQEEELIRLGAHEFFGEKALIANESRKANVIAVTDTECLVLDRAAFQAMLADVSFEDPAESRRKRDEEEEEDQAQEAEVMDHYKPTTNYAFADLQIIRTIGTGTFGRVKLVQHLPTGKVCALKCMDKTQVEESHQTKNIMSERNLLCACSGCPFILELMQTYNHPSTLMMLMEFIQGGELWTYMYDREEAFKRNALGGLAMPAIKFLSANVLLAFKFMHNKGLAYRCVVFSLFLCVVRVLLVLTSIPIPILIPPLPTVTATATATATATET
jgi:CRP-like cAMP-binding protein